MFADTITITINSVAKVLNRIADDGYTSEYYLRSATEDFRMKIRHSTYLDKTRSNRKVDRHNVELVQTVFGVAPNPNVVRKSYVVIENDNQDGVTDPLNFTLGFAAFLNSGNVTKLLNWES
nr:MAG: hypothetical protein 2 [Leviviridae sp.]